MNRERKQQVRRRSAAAGSLVALLAAGGALAGCSSGAGEGELVGSAGQSISGGVTDVSHRSVFLLLSYHDDQQSMCTATLVAPNLLLTARHCVSAGADENVLCGDAKLGEPYPANAFYATNDPQPREESPFFSAHDVKVPVQGGDTCGYDIALIVLDDNVPTTLATPSVPRIDREVIPGETYTAVGYGVDENGRSTGTRMERTGLNVDCQPGSCGSGVESTEFRGETGICSGDSGGPALDADGKVVGVVSRGGPNCGTPIYGTVTAWRKFLIDVALEAAVLGGYEAPFWATTGLSDPPVVPDPVEPVDEGAAEGEACSSRDTCAAGLACYASSDGNATCAKKCTATSDCDAGLVCKDLGSSSVCTPPVGGGDDEGGCSVAAPQGSRGWLALALLGLGFGLRRRAAHR
jgi:MYXO-CTERM domain-containing protein